MMKKESYQGVLNEPNNLSEPELQVIEEPHFADFHLTTPKHARKPRHVKSVENRGHYTPSMR